MQSVYDKRRLEMSLEAAHSRNQLIPNEILPHHVIIVASLLG